MELRQALLWSGLLLGSQATDTLTTALDRAQGAVEAMPLTARLLETGGVTLLWTLKLMIVASAAATLVAAARRVRDDPQRLSVLTYRVCLTAVQSVTICLAFVSLSNLALFGAIS